MNQDNLGNVLANLGARTTGRAGTQLLDEAITAFLEVLKVRTKEVFPQHWAMTQNNLGTALYNKATRTPDEPGKRLLLDAVTAYNEALTVNTRDALPQQWAATQTNLATALREQGIRTKGEPGMRLLAEAVSAYHKALTVYTKETLPQHWALTQHNLGIVLRDQGIRTDGDKGRYLLTEAIAAYREVLTVYTKNSLPEQWAMTQRNLARASVALEDWRTAVGSYHNLLMFDPDDVEAYQSVRALYQEKLFAYKSAFEVTKQWLKRHPNDVEAQANFAEAHFTNGLFSEAKARFAELLKDSKMAATARLGMSTLEMATLIVTDKPESLTTKLGELNELLLNLPSDIGSSWIFEGCKHFVAQDPILAPYRTCLLNLFSAVEEKDAQTRFVALEKVQAGFTTITKRP